MRIFTHKDVSQWDECLPYVEMYLNSTPTTTGKKSPYYIVHGKNINLPVDIVVDDKVL